jgi:hypothetical protein
VINGEHYGPPTDFFLGVQNTNSEADVPRNDIAYHSGGLYEVLIGAIVFAIVWPVRRRLSRPTAMVWTVLGLPAGPLRGVLRPLGLRDARPRAGDRAVDEPVPHRRRDCRSVAHAAGAIPRPPEPILPMSESGRQQLAGLAAILSFLVPGLGHLLIGAWLRGAIWLAGWLVALTFIASLDALLYARTRLTRPSSPSR